MNQREFLGLSREGKDVLEVEQENKLISKPFLTQIKNHTLILLEYNHLTSDMLKLDPTYQNDKNNFFFKILNSSDITKKKKCSTIK
ncbi:hypothetical protein AB3N60_19180 (plasmid) [Leptospira sp. WS39.C2]